jgi:hypothetical protein
MNRKSRLQSALKWLAQYPGKNILRGYRKHFAVDFECAIKELVMLGISLDAQYVSQVRQSCQAQVQHRQTLRQAKLDQNTGWRDEYFGIIDDPSGGVDPFEDPFLWDRD